MVALILAFSLQTSEFDALLDNPKLSGSMVSCSVVDESGTTLFERNPGIRVMPASNQKLLTNSYALYKLGPDYQPKTRIWKFSNKVIVDSEGDPMLTSSRLAETARKLGLTGKLPVYVHEAYRPLIPPSWEWDDLPNKYAAPITAFTVDRGSIELWAEGERLSILPRNYGLRPRRGARSGKRMVTYDPFRRTLTVSGELPKARTRIDTLALDYPDKAAASLLGRSFATTSSLPPSSPSATILGTPLRETIKECLVKSDNNLAENLLLMAANRDEPLGDKPYTVAPAKLKYFLTNVVGASEEDFRPYDGSGMSRHNLVTTRGIVKLLNWAAKQPTNSVWMDALVRPGAGTLSSRLDGVSFVGKTGTLDMVVALSGYVKTMDNRRLTVSLILDHFICSEKDARSIADDFIKKLAASSGNGTVSATASLHEARTANSRSDTADVHRHPRPRLDRSHAR